MEEEKENKININTNKENNNNSNTKEEEKNNENHITELIKKKTPIFELLNIKEKETRNLEKLSENFKEIYNIYKSLKIISNNNIKIKKQNININELITKLMIPIDKRTMDDIYIIRQCIKKTKIEKLFYDEIKTKEKLYNICLLFICLFIKFKIVKKDEIIYRIGEQPDYMYLIFEGRINILKPIPKIRSLTGYEYFLKLMEYRKNKDMYLYSLCIQENTINYEIKKKDKDLLPYIYLTYRLNEIKKRIFVDFKTVFEIIGLPPPDLGLNPGRLHSIGYIYKKMKQIKSKMPLITEEELKLYKFIDEKELKKDVTIFENETFLKCDRNNYFGDNAFVGKVIRNETVKTEEDCYLGYIDINLYSLYFYQEKKAIYDKKINFLYTNFFFQKISSKKFEKKYSNFFLSENYANNDYIYNENSPPAYTYFIEEGTVELTSSKSILEIELLLKKLKEKNGKINGKLIYDKIYSNRMEIENFVLKKQMNKLLVLGKKNILGLESFYYQIPYLTNARVISPTAKIIKIDSEHLYQILKRSPECMHEFLAKVENNIKIITKRYYGINNMKLKRIDDKINLDIKMRLEKLEEKNNKNKKIIKSRFLKRKINIINLNNNSKELINSSTELKNIPTLKEEKKNFRKKNFSLILTDDNNLLKRPIINSAFFKKRLIDYYNIGKLATSSYEKILLKKAKKDMISLRKGKYFSLININDNNNNNNKSTEKSTQINNDIRKVSSLIKIYHSNDSNTDSNNNDVITFKKSDDNSFEFVTKVNNIKPNYAFNDNKDNKDIINKPKKLPKLFEKIPIVLDKDNLTRNKNKSIKELNINFSYNNRIIKNYSFINRYIYKDKKEIIKDIDPKEKYKIFDTYSKRKTTGVELTEMKKYIPKTIRSKNYMIKIKKYQDYRKTIQRKIEEMTS